MKKNACVSVLRLIRCLILFLAAPMEDICLTDEQIHAFQEAFELFDKNGGGTIDAFELQVRIRIFGIKLTQLENSCRCWHLCQQRRPCRYNDES